jgi:ABC-type lipoprotein export system ATPase subunit
MSEVIQLVDVSLSYQTASQRVDLFSGFNLSVQTGDFFVITGRSGSGKSSILNMISGFVKPTRGEVFFLGNSLSKMNQTSLNQLRNQSLGFVFQSFNLIDLFTVYENVALPLIIAGKDTATTRKRVSLLLEKLGMSERTKHFPHQLSGGEQQRVAIARALIHEPTAILADEPTGNLDKKTADSIMGILHQINSEGTTIVIVTHDLNVVKFASKSVEIE